jgi:IS1 family transposase
MVMYYYTDWSGNSNVHNDKEKLAKDDYKYYVERARERLIKRKVLRVILSCVTGEHCKVAHEMMNLARPMLSVERNHEINEAYLRKILHVTGVVDEDFDG